LAKVYFLPWTRWIFEKPAVKEPRRKKKNNRKKGRQEKIKEKS